MLIIYIRKKLKLKLLPKLLLRRILIFRITRIKILAGKRVSRQRRKMWKMRKMRTILLNILLWMINRDFNTMLRPTIV